MPTTVKRWKRTDYVAQWTTQITDQVLRMLDAGESCRTICREHDLSFLFVARIRRQWLASQPAPRRHPKSLATHHAGPARRCHGCGHLITTPLCVLCGLEVA